MDDWIVGDVCAKCEYFEEKDSKNTDVDCKGDYIGWCSYWFNAAYDVDPACEIYKEARK